MGMIQQNINQGLSIASFLFSQTDFAKTKAKVQKINAEQKTAEKAQEVIAAAPPSEATEQMGIKVGEKQAELAEQKFEAEPTKENLEEAEKRKRNSERAKKGWETRKANQEKAAQESARIEEEAKQAQKEEKLFAERQAAASEVIRSHIVNPRAIADAEYQAAVEAKRETLRRKGGMMYE
jgi:hypothetical protein